MEDHVLPKFLKFRDKIIHQYGVETVDGIKGLCLDVRQGESSGYCLLDKFYGRRCPSQSEVVRAVETGDIDRSRGSGIRQLQQSLYIL